MPLFHPSTFSSYRSDYTKWADKYYKEEEKNKDKVISGQKARINYLTRLLTRKRPK